MDSKPDLKPDSLKKKKKKSSLTIQTFSLQCYMVYSYENIINTIANNYRILSRW